ncbi:D,D-dipeptide ABC transporter permease [Escherichia coli]|nr:D,D-dipeptide ABC transporter permease [Escherichia coli]EER7911609.1 D,D-dipeptide ABC transporter permease [Escherichia coli]EER9914933.1 D,D-dipeptide ABC transporter permease [Escherichia coli]EES6861670.1 D,D-dipeptide ABC transporter permease [Escherichia coli]EET5802344.1 D,D-dipeptide ABC transporter permease [Escherichia coli]
MTFWSILRQRCWGLVLVVAGVCVITFIISHLIPGDPARLLAGDRASDAIVENIRQQLGLDQPLYVQFYRYVMFSRVLVGSQQSILAGLVVVAIAGMIGSLLGCLSGVLGGRADAIIMRIMDIMLSIPSLVLTMALAAALGPSLFNAMLAIAIVRIPFYVRLARGQALVVRQYTYVQAAKTFGASRWHLISWHILRNSLPPLIVQASLDIGSAILMAATLGFIGLGAQQPSAEWGAMVANGRNYVLDQWWYCAFPGAAILLTAVGFNLFGDGIRDLLDPKAGGKQS